MLSKFLGPHKYSFHPWWFGDPYTKNTGLWGYFNKPERVYFRTIDVMTKEQIEQCAINNRKLPSISDFTGSKQSAKRAITPPGFAKAFYEANQ